MITMLLTIALLQTTAGPTDRTALVGLWVREEAPVTVDPEPAWQRIRDRRIDAVARCGTRRR